MFTSRYAQSVDVGERREEMAWYGGVPHDLEISASQTNDNIRAAPLVRVKAQITVKTAVCMSRRLTVYGEFDCEFDYDSQEWRSSQDVNVDTRWRGTVVDHMMAHTG